MLKGNWSLAVILTLPTNPLPEALAELTKWSVESCADALSVSNELVGFSGADIKTGVSLSLYMNGNGGVRGEGGGKEGNEN
jgi:hypothetical protein